MKLLKFIFLFLALGAFWLLADQSIRPIVVLFVVLVPGSQWYAGLSFVWIVLCLMLRTLLPWFAGLESQTNESIVLAGLVVIGGVLTARGRAGETAADDLVLRVLGRFDWGHVRAFILLLVVAVGVVSLERLASMFNSLCWIALLLLTAWNLPKNPRRPAAYLGEYALLFFSLVIGVGALEIGMRVFVPERQHMGRAFEPHPDYIFTLKPNGALKLRERISEDEYIDWRVEISPQGFRDRVFESKRDDEFRILMLGDSFTLGHLPLEDSIPKILERKFANSLGENRVSVVNAGVSASGQIQQLGILRERGLALDPDLVLLQVYPSNDMDNCLDAVDKRMRAYIPRRNNAIQRLKLEAKGYLPARLEANARRHIRLYREYVRSRHTGDILENWLSNLRFIEPLKPPIFPPPLERPLLMEPDLVQWYPELTEGFELLEGFVVEMRDECEKRGIPFAGFSIPSSRNVDDANWKAFTDSHEDEYEKGKACRMVKEMFARNSIPYFSLMEPLKQGRPVSELYYPYDNHLTAAGNEVAAEEAFAFVLEHFPEVSAGVGEAQ